jgi:regulator of nonsense transcripts 1
MIQFSRPKKSLAAALDPFKRHETAASEYLEKGRVPGPAPSRFDPSYYRTHDPTSFIAPDAQSVVSQAISAFPLLPKGKTYTGYASSIVSQQPDGPSAPPSIAFSQFDRLGESKARRRGSFGSEAPTASMYAFGYKAGDDDTMSIAPSQAGMTEF